MILIVFRFFGNLNYFLCVCVGGCIFSLVQCHILLTHYYSYSYVVNFYKL